MDAFDADIVIYASKGDPRGDYLLAAIDLSASDASRTPIGSTLLATETLVPGVDDANRPRVEAILGRMTLIPLDLRTARIAGVLRSLYRLRSSDAAHLATAIAVGADRFITGNRRDFQHVREIEIVTPDVRPFTP